MPLSPEDAAFFLKQGYTPEQIAQADYIEEQTSRPTQTPGVASTIGRTLVAHGGSYVGGGAGAIGGMYAGGALGALGGPAAPVTVPVGALIGAALGGAGGGYVGQKAQQAIESPETYEAQQQAAAEAAQAYPYVALVTDIGAGALASGGVLSPTTAVKGVGGILGRLVGKPLTQEAKNVLLQSTINPAISTGLSLAEGNGMPSGQDLGAQALGGALFAKTWLPQGRLPKLNTKEPIEETTGSEGGQGELPDVVPPRALLPDKRRFFGDESKGIIDVDAEVKTAEPSAEPSDSPKLLPEHAGASNSGGDLTVSTDILARVIAKGATKPVSVQRIFPDLNLSDNDAAEILRQADVYADLLDNSHQTIKGEQNATGIREDTGLTNQGGKLGEESKTDSSSNLVETPPRSEESISQPTPSGVKLPKGAKQVDNPQFVNPLTGESSKVNAPPSSPKDKVPQVPLQLRQTLLNNRGTVGGVLHSLATSNGHEYQTLAKHLLSISDTKSLNVKILHDATLDRGGNRSHYNQGTDEIRLGTSSTGDASIVLEEAIHAMTSKKVPHFGGMGEEHYNRLQTYLKTGKDENVKNLIRAYIEAAQKLGIHDSLFKDNNEHLIQDVFSKHEFETKMGVAGVPDEAVGNLPLSLSHGTRYGMGNLHEFIAQAFKDPSFQRILDKIPTDDGRTIWQQIVDAVRRILGIDAKHGNMLDRVLRTSSELVAQNRPDNLGKLDLGEKMFSPSKDQTETPEFKKWFGDSKVVDSEGKPLVVYHATQHAGFDVFKTEYEGSHFGTKEQASNLLESKNYSRDKTINNALATGYADSRESYLKDSIFGEKEGTHPVYLKIEHPMIVKDQGHNWEPAINKAKQMGFDGLKYSNSEEGAGDSYVAFHPEQIKSAIGNKGTFDPNNPSIIHANPHSPEGELLRFGNKSGEKVEPIQPTFLGGVGRFMTNTLLRARQVSPEVSDAYHRFFSGRQQIFGDVYGKVKNVMDRTGFSTSDGHRLVEAMRQEELTKKQVPMSFFKNQAQKQVWQEYKKVYREQGEEAVKDKQPVFDYKTKQYRIRQLSDTSHPLMMSTKVANTIRDATDAPTIQRLHDEFIADQAKRGIPTPKAEENYLTVVKALRGSASGTSDIGGQNHFNANRRAQGVPLPDTWTKQDFEDNLYSYAARNAADRSHYKNIETNPGVMAQLGEKNDAWGKPIPPTNKPIVANNRYVQALTREAHGEVGPQGFYTERAGSGLSTALFISSPALSAVHVPISNIAAIASLADNPVQLGKALMSGIKGMTSGIATAQNNGLLVPRARPAARMFDANLTSAEKLQTIASVVRRIASFNDLTTKANIGYMQAAMESIVPSKLTRAEAGDINAQQFMRKLDPDYTIGKDYTPEQLSRLATEAVGYLHGTNDPRTMPEWMMRDSEISGFFSIAHWSVAQTDRFMRDVWMPAKRGNVAPLILGIAGAAVGGEIIKKLREEISGKHSPIPGLVEIINSDRGIEGNAGPLAYNAMAALQYAGFGGLFSQLAKYPFDLAYKNMSQALAFPLDEEVSDIASTASNVVMAIMADPNINYVDLARLVGTHVLTSDFRLAREGYNQLINAGIIQGTLAERKFLSDKLGKLRRFEQVSGLPFEQESEQTSNPFMFPEQQEFKRTQDVGQAMKDLPTLMQNIMSQYGEHPDVALMKLRSLKDMQYNTMPNMENYPMSFQKYITYLQRMEGPQAAQQALQEYMQHKVINQVKGSAVP